MDKNNLKSLHKSFKILGDRKAKLLEEEKEEIAELQELVKEIRKYSIEHLKKLISIAKNEFENNGIEYIFAEDSKKALEAIYHIIEDEKIVAKSKSNTINEIGLAEFLESKGIELVETDLGDRIVQIDPDSSGPSHPIGPAAHLDM
ncbi:MAG: LUD domain-containing protein, partial [Methanobacterium sp.]